MLIELVKKHKEWVSIAYYFCKNIYDAEDLIQDLYLKLADSNKNINFNSMFFIIKNMYIDNYRKKKNLPIKVELNDNLCNFEEYDYESDNLKELALLKVKELPFFERELLEVSTKEISQRELARQTDISFIVINQTIKKTKKQLLASLKNE